MREAELPRIGLYTPVRSLGEGATTHTYLYRNEQRKKYVVIKLTRKPLVTLEDKEAFLARAKLLKKLKHRNIMEVQDANLLQIDEDDYGYLVMQYTEGSTSRERFVPGQLYSPDEVRLALSSMADALHFAHALHITHGNLHPGNILREKGKEFFLLADFSLALPNQASAARTSDAALPYRAPEELRGAPPTPASDQYTLAVIAYEWLCGRRPYAAIIPAALLTQQEHEPLPAPSSLNKAITPQVEAILLQALALDPAERFPQTLTFADAYLRALMGLPPLQTSSTASVPARARAAAITTITGATLAPETTKVIVMKAAVANQPQEQDQSKKKATEITLEALQPSWQEVTKTLLPFPIARAFSSFEKSVHQSPPARLKELLNLSEAIVYYLHSLLVADQLQHLKIADADLTSKISGSFTSYSIDRRLEVIFHILKIVKQKPDINLFIPELINVDVGICQEIHIKVRNVYGHTNVAEPWCQQKLDTYRPRLEKLLKSLQFLKDYNLAQITKIEYRKSHFIHSIISMMGDNPLFQPQTEESESFIRAETSHVTLISKDHDVLDIHPFYLLHAWENTGMHSHLCFLKQLVGDAPHQRLKVESTQGVGDTLIETDMELSSILTDRTS